MNEWREVKLGDVAELQKESWKAGEEELPYIGLEHIVEKGLRINGIGNSNEVTSNKYRFNTDTFLFGKLRPYFKKLYRPKFKGICSTDIWVVKPIEGNDKDFLFYFFANQEFVDLTYSGSSGTRMPRADWGFMKESKWLLPPLSEQKAIAEVLSSLDDKIDLLHRQNETLEKMAEILFRQWFIEEADDSWEEGVLGDVLKPQRGKNITRNNMISGEYSVIAGGLSPSGYHNQFNTECPVITISASGANAGYVQLHYQNVWASDCSYVDSTVYKYIYYIYLLLKVNQQLIYDKQEGSAQPHIYPSHLMQIELCIPPEDIINKYNGYLKIFFEKIGANTKQIQTLSNLRDTLLPRLMSGEVRINNKKYGRESRIKA